MQVKANKELCDAWLSLGELITQLGDIVELDQDVNLDFFDMWLYDVNVLKLRLSELGNRTIDYVKKGE